MVDDLNEIFERDPFRRNARKVLMREGYSGQDLENRINEMFTKPPSKNLVKIFQTGREKIKEMRKQFEEKGYVGEVLEKRVRDLKEKDPSLFESDGTNKLFEAIMSENK